MSNVGRKIFQPESTFNRFQDLGSIEQFISDMQAQIAAEMDNSYNVLGDARNIALTRPKDMNGNPDSIQEAIATTVQEALYPLLTNGLNALIPKKIIVAFSGTLVEARTLQGGWGVCDGAWQNGVKKPDLRHKFLRGAGVDAGAGAMGGTETITVTLDPHSDHIVNDNLSVNACDRIQCVEPCPGGVQVSDDEHIHTLDGEITIDNHEDHTVSHPDNKPPYYEVIWLIKL